VYGITNVDLLHHVKETDKHQNNVP